MTWSAWALLGATWAVITFFTVRFFLGVLRATEEPDADDRV